MADAVARKRHKRKKGSESPHAKLNDDQRSEAIALAKAGVPYPEIGERFGVTGACIYQVRKKHTQETGEEWTPWTVRSPQHMSRWKKPDE
jgi:DNA invertase Pin-like site-specific DNA recombinase